MLVSAIGMGAARRILLLLLASGCAAEFSKCGMGGDKCSMPRDCCEAHVCAEGDWAENSDFMCMRDGDKPSDEEYLTRLRVFYSERGSRALRDDVFLQSTLTKWSGREELLCAHQPPACCQHA